MGIRLLRGRFFSRSDTADSRLVVAIDDIFAQWLFAGDNPIGQRIVIPIAGLDAPREIVGIVNHVKQVGLSEGDRSDGSQMYIPLAQMPDELIPMARHAVDLIVRADRDIAEVLPAVTRAVGTVDAQQPIYRVRTLNDAAEATIADQRIAMVLLAVFALVALTLSAIGVFGVVSYATRRRRYEVGLRLAVGARPGEVVRHLVAQGLGPVLAGTAAGLALSAALTRLVHGLLFAVSATDPPTFLIAAGLVVGVAALACYLPARRAAQVDPTTTLRLE